MLEVYSFLCHNKGVMYSDFVFKLLVERRKEGLEKAKGYRFSIWYKSNLLAVLFRLLLVMFKI